MKVEVDGRVIEVAAGATLLEAARVAGSAIPTLCHDDRLSPAGSCRVCLVAVEGGAVPVAACTTEVSEGMRVQTDAAESRRAARGALELIASSLPERALSQAAGPGELVRACEALEVDREDFGGEHLERGTDLSHPYIKLDRDLCIACGRCVRMCNEVQGTFALELAGRGFATVVAPATGGPWADSDCVACGGCVDTCPTGALFEPTPGSPEGGAQRTVETTCGYCGVGCALDVVLPTARWRGSTPLPAAPSTAATRA